MEENFGEKILWWFISLVIFVSVGYILINSEVIGAEFLSFEGFLSLDALRVYLHKIIFSVILFFIFGIVLKIIQAVLLSKFVKKKVNSDAYIGFIKLFGILWWVFFGVVVLTIFLDNLGGLVTSLGLIGFGLTLALQKPILNFVGWLTINFKLIYKIGDRIEVGDIRGDVKEIAVMNTVLDAVVKGGNAREHKTITFPNELVLTNDVVNFTKDSNYILDDLVITITYESDYHRASKILDKIVTKVISENRKSYQKFIKSKSKEIEDLIRESTIKLSSKLKKRESKEIEKQIQDNRAQLEEHQRKMDVLEEEFVPRLRVEMQDSAVALEVFYLVPYDAVKKTRTKIILDFMDEIAKITGIEIAYPHMEIVYQKDKMKYDK